MLAALDKTLFLFVSQNDVKNAMQTNSMDR